MAGLISGVIKVPEGVVSLGAELIDAGFDTNTAEEVEKFFDKINVFEEIADDSAVGKIVETLVKNHSYKMGYFKEPLIMIWLARKNN